MCVIATQAQRSAMAPQAFAKSPGARVLQNPVIMVSAVLSDHTRAPYNDRRVFDKRQQLECQPKLKVLFCISPIPLLVAASSGRSALRSDAHNTPTVTSTHLRVIAIQARRSEVAPRGFRKSL